MRIRIEGFEAIAGEVLFVRPESGARFEPLLGYVTPEQAADRRR